MSGDNEELRAQFEVASTAVEDYLTRCEEYAVHMLEKHGKGTTWPEYAPLMSDNTQPPVVREAANVMMWVDCCRKDIAEHGKLARDIFYRATMLHKYAFARDILTGRKQRKGGEKGRNAANEGKGKDTYPELRAYFEQMQKKGFNKTEAYSLTADEYLVSERTVRRAVKEGK